MLLIAASLLKSALALLLLVQGPNIDAATRDRAISVASQAISYAKQVISQEAASSPLAPFVGVPASFTGKLVCLPHRPTAGAQTLECAYGLLAANGYYYGLQSSNIDVAKLAASSTQVKVEGTLKGEASYTAADTAFAGKYSINGIIVASGITGI